MACRNGPARTGSAATAGGDALALPSGAAIAQLVDCYAATEPLSTHAIGTGLPVSQRTNLRSAKFSQRTNLAVHRN
jgi:hypothetical protein